MPKASTAQPATTVTYFLHTSGNDFLSTASPTATAAASKDSPALDRSGYRAIGTWAAAPQIGGSQLVGLSALRLWLGNTDSRDRPVQFDLRAELLKNGVAVAAGEALRVRQLKTDPAQASQVWVYFKGAQNVALASGDVLSLRILAKESGQGKKASVGIIRLYYDSVSRPAQFGASLVTANTPPVANAGPDQTVFVGDTVTLNGSGSSDADGDPLTFGWFFASRPSGSAATLSDSSAVNPTFVVDRAGSYTIRLVVNDGKVDSAADIVIVSTQNSRPVANAGPDQTTFVTSTVTLDGSGSSDFDGDPLTYLWSFVSRPSGSTATLQNATTVKPSFTADKFGDYTVQLIVNDGFIDSSPASVKISTVNSAPVAKAGANQTALVGDLITLDGSGSTDVDGNSLTYRWSILSKPAGSAAALDNGFSVNPAFTIDLPGQYVAQLIVNDGVVDSSPSSVTISTANSPPVANAGANQAVFVGDTAQLNGSGSTDVDGDLLGFAWSIISKPSNSLATLSNSFIVNPTFLVDAAGDYVVQLVVTDGKVSSKPGTMTVSTQNRPPVAVAGAAQTVAVKATVQLDGSGSNDPDKDALTYSWALLSKPSSSAAALANATSAKPTFIADLTGTYIAQLIVNDGKVNSAPDTVTVSTNDSVPIANAGPDQIVSAGTTVQLDGSASSDPDGADLFYAWSFTTVPAESAAALSNPASATPTFFTDKRGVYVGQLMVSDGTLVSAPDTVMITAGNRPPVARDDSAVTVLNTPVIVNVLGNDSDADGDPLAVASVTQPAQGKAAINANNTVTYTPAAGFTGSDSFTYTIADGQGGTAGATVRVTVNPIVGCAAPVITNIDPLTGPVGTEVTITGTNLNCGNNFNLTLNGIQLVITALSATQIKTFIPIGGQDGLITLTTDGGSVTQQQPYDVVLSQDFQVTVLPPSASVMQGSTTTYVIELASNGPAPFVGTALLNAAGLPPGASAFFSPAVLTAGQKATLNVTAASNTPLGATSFQINAVAIVDGQQAQRNAGAQLQVLQSGTTALAGSVLDTDGNPIAGVTVRIGSIPSAYEAVTNPAGTFLLLDPPAGTQLVFIDGQTVPNNTYPTIPINVTIVAGIVNQLPFTPFLHVQKNQNFTLIDSTKDTIATDPDLPGVTLTIPAGTQIIGWDGQPNQKVSIRAVPIDRLPIKPPPAEVTANIVYMFYFGKVGGGVPSQPIPFSAPNSMGLDPGQKADLWYYDESPIPGQAPNDWRIAGTGTVSADGTTIVSDPGVGIPKFCCGATIYNQRDASRGQLGGLSSPLGGGQNGGDPVDLATGIFTLVETDMVLPGRVPLIVTRAYRSGDFTSGPFGRGTTMSYDDTLPMTAPGVLTYVYRGSTRTQFFLQPDGSYQNQTVPAFRGTRITINAATGVRSMRHRDGTVIDFDSAGQMLTIRDRNGNQVTLGRSSGLNADKITEPTGRSLNFTYSGGHATTLTDPLGRTVRYEYDASSRLIKVTRPDGSTTQYGYDNLSRMTSITDARGITYLKNTYDTNSRVCEQEQADGGKFKMYYITADRASLPESWQLLQQAAAGGPITMAPCSGFLSSGVVVASVIVDPMGHPTTYRFNSMGFLISTTNAIGQTAYVGRDAVTNQPVAYTDPLRRTSRFEYDAAGNVTKVTDPAGNVRTFDYEPTFNRLTRTVDPLGNITTFEYDGRGNLTGLIDPEQNLKPIASRLKATIGYNSVGQPITLTDVLGHTTTFAYDNSGNLSTITDPLGNSITKNYDVVSRLILQSDARGKKTKIAYDLLDRVTEIVDPLNAFTTFAYDGNGNLLGLTDARGNSLSFAYDVMDRMFTRTDQLGRSDIFSYDLNGNLIGSTDRNGQASTYQYDALSQRIGGVYADGSSVRYQFDAVGRLLRISDSTGGELYFSYDGLDRLIASYAELGVIRYSYDKAGRRTAMIPTGQLAINYSYDANSRLLQVARGTQVVNLEYDALNRRTKLTLPNGTSTEYVYDIASQLTGQIYKNATGTLGNLTYQYDAAGNQRGVGGSFAQTVLPDAVASANYDVANRQLQFGDKSMTYDFAGNLKTLTTFNSVTNLAWDARLRLSSISGLGMAASFSYDALNRRRSRQINGQLSRALYDGLSLVGELTGTSTNTYLNNLAIDEPWGRNSGEYYMSDGLGNAIGLTDNSGSILNRYNYEPFGKTVVQGPSTNPLQFTGRENDGTGFYHYRARYYSPELNRFISEDPIGLQGGDVNFYSYVSNDPRGAVDPLGLQKWDLTKLAKDLASIVLSKAAKLERLNWFSDFYTEFARCPKTSVYTAPNSSSGVFDVFGAAVYSAVDAADCAKEAAKSATIPGYNPFGKSGSAGNNSTPGSNQPPNNNNVSPSPSNQAPADSCTAGGTYPCWVYGPAGNKWHMTNPRVYDQYCARNGACQVFKR